jgi:hypothetical protein
MTTILKHDRPVSDLERIVLNTLANGARLLISDITKVLAKRAKRNEHLRGELTASVWDYAKRVIVPAGQMEPVDVSSQGLHEAIIELACRNNDDAVSCLNWAECCAIIGQHIEPTGINFMYRHLGKADEEADFLTAVDICFAGWKANDLYKDLTKDRGVSFRDMPKVQMVK